MTRARELGIRIGELEPGPLDAITDVAGVLVGHTTLWEGDDVRTGVTVVVPPELPCFAGAHRLNGNGELTGLEWVRESGLLTSQIGLTNTYSVGVVRDAIVSVRVREGTDLWHLPVVGETYDGFLNDIQGMHGDRRAAPPPPMRAARAAGDPRIGRTGGAGENSSGDLILCFATGNRGLGGGGDGEGPSASRCSRTSVSTRSSTRRSRRRRRRSSTRCSRRRRQRAAAAGSSTAWTPTPSSTSCGATAEGPGPPGAR